MNNNLVNHVVEIALSVVFGIFIVNMCCSAFLGIDFIEIAQKLIAKLTGSNDED